MIKMLIEREKRKKGKKEGRKKEKEGKKEGREWVRNTENIS